MVNLMMFFDYRNAAVRCLGAIILLAFLGFCVQAQNLSSATILSSSGSVQISRPGGVGLDRLEVRVGVELFAGDVVKTGFNGRLVIGLKDGSQAIISQNTTVEIRDTNNSPRTIFNVLRGKTRIKIEKLGGRPNPYRVTTPTTVIAVRGTIFDVFVKKDETKVFVIEGEVSVSRIDLPDLEVILTPGEFTRVKGMEAPQPPASFKMTQNDDVFSRIPTANPGQSPFNNPSVVNPGRSNDPANPGGNPANNPAVPANPAGRRKPGN